MGAAAVPEYAHNLGRDDVLRSLLEQPVLRMKWLGPVAEFLTDETRHLDLEGAIRSGKTTAALWKVLDSCLAHPGIHWLICRYTHP